MPADITFKDLAADPDRAPLECEGLSIRWAPMHHPGGSTAYRIDESGSGSSVVFATDVDWAGAPEHLRKALIELCTQPSATDMLVFDGQFTDEEYEDRKSWGHSSVWNGVRLARKLGVRELIVTHHDPWHDDATLTALEHDLQRIMPAARLARQGAIYKPRE